MTDDQAIAARHLAAIVESSDDAIVSKDLNGTIQTWNRAAERMFGYSTEEAVGRSIRLIIPADRQSEEDEVLARIRRGERVDHFETLRQRKDGSFLPVSLTISPIRDASGRVVGASKIARDISDRKRAAADLSAAAETQADLLRRLTTLVEASGSLLMTPQVEYVLPAVLHVARDLVSADAYAMWRFDAAENRWIIAGSDGLSDQFTGILRSVLHKDQPPFVETLIVEDVMQEPSLADRREVLRQEGIQSLLAVPLRIEGQPTGSLVLYYRRSHTFTDVETQTASAISNLASAALTTAELYDVQSRSRHNSEFLAEAGAMLARTLDYHETLRRVAHLAVPQFADWCAVDVVGDNGAIDRLAIVHVDPVKVEAARRFQDKYPADPDSPYGVHSVIRTARPVLLEQVTDDMLVARARDAEHLAAARALQITSFMIVPLVAHARTVGAMTFVSAESRRRYTADDLRFAQEVATRAALAVDNSRAYDEARRANQVKDDFLATLSHELRTPLNAILGYARMLKSGMLSPERFVRAFNIIEKNATALTQIVEDVLDISRIVSGKIRLNVQRVELPPIVTQAIETVQPAADARGVRIESIVEPHAPAIAGDPDRLQQVVWNLLSNAVKFTPRGGRVQVRLTRVDLHDEVVVSDTGAGIASGFLPYIFERFRQADSRFSREHGGLGLGLAIAKQLVEMHGGTIAAESEGEGRGATFRVRLPIMIAQPESVGGERLRTTASRASAAAAPVRLDGIHVLAVDDDQDALLMLREILEGAGAAVTTAGSAQGALEALPGCRPDVLLTDLGMPGMDGFELIARVRQAVDAPFGNVPAAALTAYARSEDRTRALRSGFQMHLAKPIDPAELVAAVSVLAHQ